MIKSAVRTAIASAALLLCASQANALVIVYTATLNGPSESPPIASPGVGLAIITLDDVLLSMHVQVMFQGLTSGTTASHIHAPTPAAGSGTAGVATTTPTFAGFPLGVTSGAFDVTLDMKLASSYNPAFITANGGTVASAFAVLDAAMLGGKSYINIHTTTNPGGEIRGFLYPNAPVPEPATYAMMLGGLGALGFLARRRRQS